jgi:HEAT repeat protein
MGDAGAVPTLAKLLADSATFDMALYALERIPGEAAERAIFERLSKTSGRLKIGIVNAMGNRSVAGSVPALADCLYDLDEEVGLAAAAALGKIGNAEALAALEKVRPVALGDMQAAVGDAELRCAERLVREGRAADAIALYKKLSAEPSPVTVRQAALIGQVRSDPGAAHDLLVRTITAGDSVLRSTAIALVRAIENPADLGRIASILFALQSEEQSQLLAALSETGRRAELLPVAVRAADAEDPTVRTAALKAIASLGDASSVPMLAQRAASGSGDEKTAAREGLVRLAGAGVDAAIIALVPASEPAVQVELIRCLPARNAVSATATLLDLARSDDEARVRIEAYRALADLAGQDALPALVDALSAAPADQDRREAVKAAVAVGSRIEDKDQRSDALLKKYPKSGPVPTRAAFLEAMGKLGDPDALPLIRKSLADPKEDIRIAAVTALSDWPDVKPMDELFDLAGKAKDETQRTLALRGAIRLIGLAEKPPDEAFGLYLKAFGLAGGLAEKQAVFAGVAKLASVAAMDWVLPRLSDPELGGEAEAAAVQIALRIHETRPDKAKEAVEQVLRITQNPETKERLEWMLKEMEGKK